MERASLQGRNALPGHEPRKQTAQSRFLDRKPSLMSRPLKARSHDGPAEPCSFFLFILALIARVLVSIVARCGKATANKRTSEAPLATSATISPRALHIANRRRRILTPDKSAFERRKHTTPSCASSSALSCARCSFPVESGSSDSPNNVVACARLDKRADAVRMDVRRSAACQGMAAWRSDFDKVGPSTRTARPSTSSPCIARGRLVSTWYVLS